MSMSVALHIFTWSNKTFENLLHISIIYSFNINQVLLIFNKVHFLRIFYSSLFIIWAIICFCLREPVSRFSTFFKFN